MVGVTKKEVSQMTKYYLKMDNIMKNMFVVALNDIVKLHQLVNITVKRSINLLHMESAMT